MSKDLQQEHKNIKYFQKTPHGGSLEHKSIGMSNLCGTLDQINIDSMSVAFFEAINSIHCLATQVLGNAPHNSSTVNDERKRVYDLFLSKKNTIGATGQRNSKTQKHKGPSKVIVQ